MGISDGQPGGKAGALRPPDEMKKLVDDASAERDLGKAAALWGKYQEGMVDAAHLFVLIQPTYGIRRSQIGYRVQADRRGLDGGARGNQTRMTPWESRRF